ncbi:hypothetical protein HWA77_21055 [Photobacterium damselae subsp. damselae]|uniref:Uncharacterized protein n=1 Tax=Photobacterium damselae subsp. damselae TaxID=85581 RepID=A0A850QVU7_PHODD|nr:hypothetical protein [Photobacterium damselae subsp. damselae]
MQQRDNQIKDNPKHRFITDMWITIDSLISESSLLINDSLRTTIEHQTTTLLQEIDPTLSAIISTNHDQKLACILIESCSKTLSRDIINLCPKSLKIREFLSEYRLPELPFDIEVTEEYIEKFASIYAEGDHEYILIRSLFKNVIFDFSYLNGVIECAVIYDENDLINTLNSHNSIHNKVTNKPVSDAQFSHLIANLDLVVDTIIKTIITILLGEYIIFNVIRFHCLEKNHKAKFDERFKKRIESNIIEMRNISLKFLQFV